LALVGELPMFIRLRPMTPKVYPFEREALARRGYRVFPDELENDELIFFHATSADRLKPIVDQGLKPGIEVGGTLATISYALTSNIALTHWVQVRADDTEGVILALRFDDLSEIFEKHGTHYSLALRKQPIVIGTCAIPSTYEHI
jgi:hypothetical protein